MATVATSDATTATQSLTNYVAYLPQNSKQPRIGHLDLDSETITPLSYTSGTLVRSLYEVIEAGDSAFVRAGDPFPRTKVKLLPPIYGRDILAVGKNYAVSKASGISRFGY